MSHVAPRKSLTFRLFLFSLFSSKLSWNQHCQSRKHEEAMRGAARDALFSRAISGVASARLARTVDSDKDDGAVDLRALIGRGAAP